MESITKFCNRCSSYKSKDDFYNNTSICKECSKKKAKEWCKKNPDKRKKIANKYAKNNLEKRNLWVKNNKESVNSSKRKYYKNNRDYIRGLINQWNKNNKDKLQEYKRNRRAREEGNGGNITAKQWLELCEKYGNRCLCCGSKEKKLTLDHVIPLALGGKHEIDNAQPLCLSCNLKKATKIIDYRVMGETDLVDQRAADATVKRLFQ